MTVLVNGERREFAAGTAVTGVVRDLTGAGPGDAIPPRGIAVALNGAVVPRTQWSATVLADGDRLEVLTAVQGG